MYVIWSTEHRGWWRPARRGYTHHLAEAGAYSRDVALDICREANKRVWPPGEDQVRLPEEIMILLDDARALVARTRKAGAS